MFRVFTALSVVALFALAGCQKSITVAVDTHRQAGFDYQPLHRFAVAHEPARDQRRGALLSAVAQQLRWFIDHNGFAAAENQRPMMTGQTHPAAVKEVGAVARRIAEHQGWHADAHDPQFVISVDCVTGPYAFYVPQRLDPNPTAQGAGTSRIGAIDGRDVRVADPSAGERISGHPAQAHAHAVALYIYAVDGANSQLVWSGSAITIGDEPNFNAIAPHLVDELMSEFPTPSAKPALRKVVIAGAN